MCDLYPYNEREREKCAIVIVAPRSITDTLKLPNYFLCWMNWAMANSEHCFKAPEHRKSSTDMARWVLSAPFSRLVYDIYTNISCFPGKFKNTIWVALECPTWKHFFKNSYVPSNRSDGLSSHFCPSDLEEALIEVFFSSTDELLSGTEVSKDCKQRLPLSR